MLNKWVLAAAAAAMIAVPATASAQGVYVRVEGGLATGDISDDEEGGSIDLEQGYTFGGAVGLKMPGGLAFEGEALHISNDIDLGDASSIAEADASLTAALANVVYRLPLLGPLSPVVGAGVGYGTAELNVSSDPLDVEESGEESGLVWQARAGLSMSIAPGAAVEVNYRYLSGDFDGVEVTSQAVLAGLRFSLGL